MNCQQFTSSKPRYEYDAYAAIFYLGLSLIWPRETIAAKITRGISVTIPVDTLLAAQAGYDRVIGVIYSLIWILGLTGTMAAFSIIRREINQREGLILQLQTALGEVKTLKGFIPICASCKRIRDDAGYWEQIEIYIRDRSEAEFSHGICPKCMEKLYPEYINRPEKEEP